MFKFRNFFLFLYDRYFSSSYLLLVFLFYLYWIHWIYPPYVFPLHTLWLSMCIVLCILGEFLDLIIHFSNSIYFRIQFSLYCLYLKFYFKDYISDLTAMFSSLRLLCFHKYNVFSDLVLKY